MDTIYDIAVIGSGPGGYVAAIRAAQLGLKTVIIEKYPVLGGTCTNVGCIPAKALLDSTEHYHLAQTKFAAHGIKAVQLSLDFGQLMARKADVVKQNTNGLNYLMRKNKIDVLQGKASFVNNKELVLEQPDGMTGKLFAHHFIIATGSKPASLPGVVLDKQRIITSTEALALRAIPKSLLIVGGGVIGAEMASVFSRIGVAVTIVEYADQLLPAMDKELGSALKKIFEKDGITVLLNHKVQQANAGPDEVTLQVLDADNQVKVFKADYCLMAVGRKAYTDGLGLEHTAVQRDERRNIKTDGHLQTAEPNIYAIGDVIGGPMLAHKAEEEGVYVVEQIKGLQPKEIHYDRIPGVVYTWPEIASVGYTEEQLKKESIPYNTGRFPFSASGRGPCGNGNRWFYKGAYQSAVWGSTGCTYYWSPCSRLNSAGRDRYRKRTDRRRVIPLLLCAPYLFRILEGSLSYSFGKGGA
jgi:dihydrolipoamide dehydrogenase